MEVNVDKAWVSAGARLHMGQLDLNGSLGRLYGGLGLALDSPRIELEASKHEGLCVNSSGEEERLGRIARKYLEHYRLPGVKIEIKRTLPGHMGFGSGTQLALGIGRAITALYGLNPSAEELAGITEREGSRSGLGVAAFFGGGFIVDGGKALEGGRPGKKAPPIVARLDFPEEWAVILALPPKSERMFGEKERLAFSGLEPMEEKLSGHICRLLLLKLLPGIAERDLLAFGQALEEIQACIGDYFAPVQGGRFACAQSAWAARCFSGLGLTGVGQSSWGPLVYGFCPRAGLEGLLEKARSQVGEGVEIIASRGQNRGASWGMGEAP
jgi:beta-RFAP synthase